MASSPQPPLTQSLLRSSSPFPLLASVKGQAVRDTQTKKQSLARCPGPPPQGIKPKPANCVGRGACHLPDTPQDTLPLAARPATPRSEHLASAPEAGCCVPRTMLGGSWGDNAFASTPTEQVKLPPDLKMNNQALGPGKEGQGPLPSPAPQDYKVTNTDHPAVRRRQSEGHWAPRLTFLCCKVRVQKPARTRWVPERREIVNGGCLLSGPFPGNTLWRIRRRDTQPQSA